MNDSQYADLMTMLDGWCCSNGFALSTMGICTDGDGEPAPVVVYVRRADQVTQTSGCAAAVLEWRA